MSTAVASAKSIGQSRAREFEISRSIREESSGKSRDELLSVLVRCCGPDLMLNAPGGDSRIEERALRLKAWPTGRCSRHQTQPWGIELLSLEIMNGAFPDRFV